MQPHRLLTLLAFLASAFLLATASQIPLVPEESIIEDNDDDLHPPTWPNKPIPLLGFGTWNLKAKNTSEAVSYAIQQGYRHIDCAAIYGNEEEVGNGIVDGLRKTGLTREHLWITSKLWNDHHDPNTIEAALDSTLHKLRTPYLDLYHMHWPVASSTFQGPHISYRDTWGALTLIQSRSTKIRHLGVSNFSPAQLRDLLHHTANPPFAHQMELHPYLAQPRWVAWHASHGIHVTAYSPLGGTNPVYDDNGDEALPPLLAHPTVQHIAAHRACTPAQVVLAWGLARGTSVIPKSVHADRIAENLGATQCALHERDLAKLERLGEARKRFNNPSEGWGVELYEGLQDARGKREEESFEE